MSLSKPNNKSNNKSDSHRSCAMSKRPSAKDLAAAVVTASSSSTACSRASSTVAANPGAGSVQTCEQQEQEHTEQNQRQGQICNEAEEHNNDDEAEINQLNNNFEQRLADVDREAKGNINMKLAIYQDWVKTLIRSNNVLLENLEVFEKEVFDRMELLTQKPEVPRRESQDTELEKCRKDICTLLRLAQNGYHHDNWSIEGMEFETVTPSELFSKDDNDHQNDGNMSVSNNKE